MGSIIWPVLVKKCETSFPCSACRAIASAGVGFRPLRVFFIKLLLLLGCFPQGHQVVVLTFLVLPHLKDERVQPAPHPANGSVLLWQIRAMVEVVRMRKDLLRLLETNSTPRVLSQPLALSHIEVESHRGITVIPQIPEGS